MNCINHKERTGINTCCKCGEWLCAECSIEKDGRIVCKSCDTHNSYRVAKSAEHGRGARPRERDINGFFLLVFSFILPGINFMYMGLMKRGLFYLSSFFLSTYFLTLSRHFALPFAFLIATIYIASFFDGFRVRRQFLNGEHPEDSINDIKSFFKRNYVGTLIALGLIFIGGMLSSLGSYANMIIRRGHMIPHADAFMLPLIIVIIILGVHFMRVGKKRHKHDHNDDHNDEQR